jgi:hypothetical protein
MSDRTTARVFTALVTPGGGRWSAHVVRRDLPAPWPERDIGPADRVPSLAERCDALRVLGYEPAPGSVWEWHECHVDPTDPASPAWLMASLRVRLPAVAPLAAGTGGGAA